jgi:hypothetical protein
MHWILLPLFLTSDGFAVIIVEEIMHLKQNV